MAAPHPHPARPQTWTRPTATRRERPAEFLGQHPRTIAWLSLATIATLVALFGLAPPPVYLVVMGLVGLLGKAIERWFCA